MLHQKVLHFYGMVEVDWGTGRLGELLILFVTRHPAAVQHPSKKQ